MNSPEIRLELANRWEDQTQYWCNFVMWIIQEHQLHAGQNNLLWQAIDLHLADYGLIAERDGHHRTVVGSEEDFLAWVLAHS